MRLALHQPDIAGNVGTIMRLAACFSVPLDIIMPCGFPASDKQLKRSAMDYAQATEIHTHINSEAFFTAQSRADHRVLLLTSHGDTRLPDMEFTRNDTLLLGSESAGVPDHIHKAVAFRINIPMAQGFRSLNIAVAAGIALSEALRQTGLYPA